MLTLTTITAQTPIEISRELFSEVKLEIDNNEDDNGYTVRVLVGPNAANTAHDLRLDPRQLIELAALAVREACDLSIAELAAESMTAELAAIRRQVRPSAVSIVPAGDDDPDVIVEYDTAD